MLKNRQDLIALREGCMAAAQLQKKKDSCLRRHGLRIQRLTEDL